MCDVKAVQNALSSFQLDGWLLYDFRGTNILAKRLLQIDDEVTASRRYLYFIPQQGEPVKLVHRIEEGLLDHLPGNKIVYLTWQELENGISQLVNECRTVAMEYSPGVSNPYVSRVDAGTIEYVRSLGIDVVSSGDLIQLFEATLSETQWQAHLQAAVHTNEAFSIAWKLIAETIRNNESINETEVQQAIMNHFSDCQMTTYHPPIVAVNQNSGDPHYETGTGKHTRIDKNDFVLIDLWAKLDCEDGIYSDLTRVGFVGGEVPDKYEKIFKIVAAARDEGIQLIESSLADETPLTGWQVDQVTRNVIADAGYEEYFVHRTGHSIGRETHGNGANIDNLETREERCLLPETLFSIEPGIYLPEFGIRSEVNVFIDRNSSVHVTGGETQSSVLPILS